MEEGVQDREDGTAENVDAATTATATNTTIASPKLSTVFKILQPLHDLRSFRPYHSPPLAGPRGIWSTPCARCWLCAYSGEMASVGPKEEERRDRAIGSKNKGTGPHDSFDFFFPVGAIEVDAGWD